MVASYDSVLNLMRLRGRALRFGELLVDAIRFANAMGLLYFDVRVAHLSGGALPNLDIVLSKRVVMLDMDHPRRTRLHMLRLEHLLLEVLAMPELVMLHRKA